MQEFTGKQYLMIDIANSFGLDKEDWSVRLQWFDDHQVDIENLPMQDLVQWAAHAEEPAQFLAGILAWRDTKAGIPTGYQAGLDATASGIQILAALSGCQISAGSVNLLGGSRQDVYTNCHQRMNLKLQGKKVIPRADLKQALMTAMYNSKAVPKRVFGEDTPELAMFYETSFEMLPGVVMLNQVLTALWQPTKDVHQWFLPDGFHARVKVMVNVQDEIEVLGTKFELTYAIQAPQEKGISLSANITHSVDGFLVREMGRRCNFDQEVYDKTIDMLLQDEASVEYGSGTGREKDCKLGGLLHIANRCGFMSAVILEYLDENNFGMLSSAQKIQLMDLLATMTKSFEIIAVHDCFKFHPNNGNHVRKHYANILGELSDSFLLEFISEEITGKQLARVPRANLRQQIVQSEYALS